MRLNDLSVLNFEPDYRTGSNHEPQEMMREALSQSCLYQRASGYFASSIFNLFKKETLEFAKAGGVINLMCSPVMSYEDLNQISLGYEAKKLLTNNILKDVSHLIENIDYENQASFLATLIHHNILNIKLIFHENGVGIFHDKTGYFKDKNYNVLSFSGSANESSNAFSGEGNFERISVYTSWEREDAKRSENTKKYVDDLWEGNVNGLGVFDFPDLAKDFLAKYTKENLEVLDKVFSPKVIKTDGRKTLMPHQKLALDNWKKSGKHGILKHATGSGKTITAIDAIRDHMNSGHPTIVLVPSKLLLKQWHTEIKQEIGEVVFLRCGGGHTNWKHKSYLKHILKSNNNDEPGGVVLAINDTASSKNFTDQLINLKNILLVVDEVHAVGSKQNSHILDYTFGYRLGLSATPERYRDVEGTKKIFDFFGGIIPPEVSLKDALKSGRLVPYDYYPTLTHLNAVEEESWINLTKKIINYIRFNDVDIKAGKQDKILSQMLINRSRIAKKAHSKVSAVSNILSDSYNEGEHWLVYCEDREQLNEINDALILENINSFIYVSDMEGSPSAELDAFTNQSGVLLSIRCLDEGVDIPKISHAIIVASSQNPRQFIQRRGRVLRRSNNKLNAVIYDCLVVPLDTSDETKFDGLILSEAKRSIEFARTARNAASAEAVLRNILINIGDDPDLIMQEIDGDEENE